MIKHVLFAAALVIASAAALPISSQAAENGTVIGVIDVEEVERNSVAWKSLSEQINTERAEIQAEIQQMQSSLESKRQELETQRSILSADAFTQKKQEFQRELQVLQRETNLRKQKLDHAYGAARQQIRSALKQVLKDIAQAEGLKLIIDVGSRTSPVLVFDGTLSIDAEALKGLDGKIQSVRLPEPQNSAQ